MDIDWHIGDVIAKLRNRRRMNQTAMAEKVGVSKATIVRAEDGDPKVSRETYINIARVLGTQLVALEVEAARLQEKQPIRQAAVSESHTMAVGPTGDVGQSSGEGLARGSQADQTPALPVSPAAIRKVAADLVPVVRARAAALARAARKPPAAAQRDASRARAGRGRSRR